MTVFYQNDNNGVVALIREDDARKYGEIKRAGGDPFAVGVRVFTFCDTARLARNPDQRRIFAGDYAFARQLLKEHVVKPCHHQPDGDAWDGYVPFSNQDYDDVRYHATPQDVIEKFDLIRKTD